MAAYVPLNDFELAEMEDDEGPTWTPAHLGRLLEEVRWQRKTVLALVKNMSGGSTKCRGCEASIYWVKNHEGKAYPVTELGLNHFADCPAREQFKR